MDDRRTVLIVGSGRPSCADLIKKLEEAQRQALDQEKKRREAAAQEAIDKLTAAGHSVNQAAEILEVAQQMAEKLGAAVSEMVDVVSKAVQVFTEPLGQAFEDLSKGFEDLNKLEGPQNRAQRRAKARGRLTDHEKPKPWEHQKRPYHR